MYDANMTKDKL